MTLKQSYQSAAQRKKALIAEELKTKKSELQAEKQRQQRSASEALRAAYATYLRADAMTEQQAVAAGYSGGTAINQRAGKGTAHREQQDDRRAKARDQAAALEGKIVAAEAAAARSFGQVDNTLAGQLEALERKEQQAAAKTAQKSSAKGSKSKSSSGSLSPSQALSLMKMGVYDASIAKVLGISDDEVRAYIQSVKKKGSTSKDNRLPGTYKPPLE